MSKPNPWIKTMTIVMWTDFNNNTDKIIQVYEQTDSTINPTLLTKFNKKSFNIAFDWFRKIK